MRKVLGYWPVLRQFEQVPLGYPALLGTVAQVSPFLPGEPLHWILGIPVFSAPENQISELVYEPILLFRVVHGEILFQLAEEIAFSLFLVFEAEPY